MHLFFFIYKILEELGGSVARIVEENILPHKKSRGRKSIHVVIALGDNDKSI